VGWRESRLKKTVVVVCQSNTVLDLGILSVLNGAGGSILIHTVPDNVTKLLKVIKTHLPDVVILSQASHTAQHSLLSNLLMSLNSIRIFTICTESNHVCINQSLVVRIYKATDLIYLVQNAPHLSLRGEKMTMEQFQERLKQNSTFNPKADLKEENL
jgi:hypothetical protein